MNPANSGQALQQFQTAQSQAQDPNAILQSQNQAMGVNAAQQTVTGLRGAIDNTTKLLNSVAPSVMGRTASSLVTNAQASRQIANEEAPISKTLGEEGTQYNEANQDLNTKQQQAKDAAQGIYQGQQDKLSYLQKIYDTLYGQEQDAAKAQQAAAAAAEQRREFDVGEANKMSAARLSASSGSNAAPSRSQITGAIQQGLASVVGRDGYVSPQDYANGLKQWLANGLPRADYNKQFKSYRDPKNGYYDYAVKQAGL